MFMEMGGLDEEVREEKQVCVYVCALGAHD